MSVTALVCPSQLSLLTSNLISRKGLETPAVTSQMETFLVGLKPQSNIKHLGVTDVILGKQGMRQSDMFWGTIEEHTDQQLKNVLQ